MAVKTFKIGEYAVGGIVKVSTTVNAVTVSFIDWDTKIPIMGLTRTFGMHSGHFNVRMFLEDHTSSYWTDKIIEWLNKHTKFDADNLNW